MNHEESLKYIFSRYGVKIAYLFGSRKEKGLLFLISGEKGIPKKFANFIS